MARAVEFGFVAAAAEAEGVSDVAAYRALIGDCERAISLGYRTAWLIEHHFSDYFPTPDPMALLSHLAARFPGLGLGTCVLVTPWHHPLRLVESIAQLAALTDAPLHLGMGRGTAKMEYDALGIDMDEAQDRFREIWDVIRLGLRGDEFTYDGAYVRVPRALKIRPSLPRERLDSVSFYGAIGSPGTAERMAELDLPPICTTIGNYDSQRATLESWKRRSQELGHKTDVRFPIMINCIVADTDEEAVKQAQLHIPHFMRAQVAHYEAHKDNWESMKTYQAWSRIFQGMKDRCEPEHIPAWSQWQLIGSPATVTERLRNYVGAGFDTFLIHTATPGVPAEIRRGWLQRFAQDVMPAFVKPGAQIAA